MGKYDPDFTPILEISPPFHGCDFFIEEVEELIAAAAEKSSSFASISFAERWQKQLPFFQYSYNKKSPFSIKISAMYAHDYASSMDAYMAKSVTKWLLPGYTLSVQSSYRYQFSYRDTPHQHFYLSSFLLQLPNAALTRSTLLHIPVFLEELKLHILSINRAKSSLHEKKPAFDPHWARFEKYARTQRSSAVSSDLVSVFMQEKAPKLTQNDLSKAFEQEISQENQIFYETKRYLLLFPQAFTIKRNVQYVSQILGFLHRFRSALIEKKEEAPQERHLQINLFKTRLEEKPRKKPVLGVLLTLNLLSETERFYKKHLLESINSILPSISYVQDSYILDRRSEEQIRSVYLEVEKQDGQPFHIEEIKTLRKKLPAEVVQRVEHVLHPIFMPQNDEELMHHIILLSNQLRYVRDLPQVMIHYANQTQKALLFTVIIARLIKPQEKALLFRKKSGLHIVYEQKKIVGTLKKKYPKEITVLRVSLSKTPFFRKDYSVDLQKARKCVAQSLVETLGDFRDYNGGMLLKKTETFEKLRALLPDMDSNREFLLEHFFYSLEPPVMQTVLSPQIMEAWFSEILHGLNQDFSQKTYYKNFTTYGDYFIAIVISSNPSLYQSALQAVKRLDVCSHHLVSSSFSIYELSVLGFAIKFPSDETKTLFSKALEAAVEEISMAAI